MTKRGRAEPVATAAGHAALGDPEPGVDVREALEAATEGLERALGKITG